MAGNNSIQFLRGSGHSFTDQLLPGQPYYDYFNNKLYIGGSNSTAINRATAIESNKYMHSITITLGGQVIIHVSCIIVTNSGIAIGNISGLVTALSGIRSPTPASGMVLITTSSTPVQVVTWIEAESDGIKISLNSTESASIKTTTGGVTVTDNVVFLGYN